MNQSLYCTAMASCFVHLGGCAASAEAEFNFPQSHAKWLDVEKMLTKFKDRAFIDKIDESYVGKISAMHELLTVEAKCSFEILKKLFADEKNLSDGDKDNCKTTVIPFMASLVLDFEKKSQDIKFSYITRDTTGKIELNKFLIGALIAMGFFCLYPKQITNFSTEPTLNFNGCLTTPVQADNRGDNKDSTEAEETGYVHLMSKLKCIFNYFNVLYMNKHGKLGNVTYERRSLNPSLDIVTDQIEKSLCDLCPFTVKSTEELQESGYETLQLYFLHHTIRKDVLGNGLNCTEDSIKFLTCPELLASLLFMEDLGENEAFVISGFQQYSKCSGRGKDFKYISRWDEMAGRSSNLKNTLVALTEHPAQEGQYKEQIFQKEIAKTYYGFLQLKQWELQNQGQASAARAPAAVKGNWACVDDSNGHALVKAMLRWISASEAGCPGLTYYTTKADQFSDYVQETMHAQCKVKDLYDDVLGMCERRT